MSDRNVGSRVVRSRIVGCHKYSSSGTSANSQQAQKNTSPDPNDFFRTGREQMIYVFLHCSSRIEESLLNHRRLLSKSNSRSESVSQNRRLSIKFELDHV